MHLKCPECDADMVFDGEYSTTDTPLLMSPVWRFMCPTSGCFREALVSSKSRPQPAESHRQPSWRRDVARFGTPLMMKRKQSPQVLRASSIINDDVLDQGSHNDRVVAVAMLLRSLLTELQADARWAAFCQELSFKGHRVRLDIPFPRIVEGRPAVFYLDALDGGEIPQISPEIVLGTQGTYAGLKEQEHR